MLNSELLCVVITAKFNSFQNPFVKHGKSPCVGFAGHLCSDGLVSTVSPKYHLTFYISNSQIDY